MHAVVRHLRPDTLHALREQVVEEIDLCRKDLVNLPQLQCSSAFSSSRWALSALYTRHASCGLRLNVDVQLPGLSRAQITRLIQLYASGERLEPKPYRRHRFLTTYTREGIQLLARVEEAHETLSGPATQKILYREYHEFGNLKFECLARLSSAQLYRLKAGQRYGQHRIAYQPTRPTQWLLAIGVRHSRSDAPISARRYGASGR